MFKFFLMLILLCSLNIIRAEDFNRLQFSETMHTSKHFRLSLAKIYGDDQPIMLKNTSSTSSFSLPIPVFWIPEKVILNIKGKTSLGLNERSQIAILVNGNVVKQYPLKTANQYIEFAVPIPVALLKTGYNQIKLLVSQHYTDICEFTEDSSLWTQIDLKESNFDIYAQPSNLVATLSQLDGLFDKSSWIEQPTVKVLTSGIPNQSELTAMGLIAQGIGQRYDFAPVIIDYGVFPAKLNDFKTANNAQVSVLLGTTQNLKSYLEDVPISKNKKPLIAVKKLAIGDNQYLVILAGNTDDQLRELATAFALKGVPWPQLKDLELTDVQLPAADNLQKRLSIPLASTGAFPLRALEFKTTTFSDRDSEGSTLKIWNNSWQGHMQVRLHLSYASGMSSQSALNVITNGIMIGSIPLTNPMGGSYDDYAITIPAGSLKPGWNAIGFQPILIPQSNGGKCQTFFNGNLGLTIYEDSTFQKFGGDELIKPDLALYSGKGSLFTEDPLGKGTSFQLTDTSSETISTGLTLVAKLTQMFERPLLNSTFTVSKNTEAKQQFWIGPYGKLPSNIQKVFSDSLPDSLQINVPLTQSATFQAQGNVNKSWDLLEIFGIYQSSTPQFTGVDLKFSGKLNKMAFIASDLIDDKTVTVLTALDATILQKGVNSLTDYGHWSQLKGSFAYWDPAAKPVYSVTYTDAPFYAYGLRGGLGLWVSQHPWIALLMTLIFIGLLTLFIRKALAIYQKHKHPWTEEV